MVSIPQEILTPIIVIFCFAGAYSVNKNYLHVLGRVIAEPGCLGGPGAGDNAHQGADQGGQLTFGVGRLYMGLDLAVCLIGLFALVEILAKAELKPDALQAAWGVPGVLMRMAETLPP